MIKLKKSNILFGVLGVVIASIIVSASILYIQFIYLNPVNSDIIDVGVIIDYNVIPEKENEYYNLTIKNGLSALDVFEKVANLTVKHYAFGVYVEGVNGYMEDLPNFYWAFYYKQENEQWSYSSIGLGQYYVKQHDIIKLRYE